MATAKRVAQDAKVEGGVTKEVREHFTIYSINGREIARKLVSTDTEVVDNRRFVLQPDRIVLDLSSEEAACIWSAMPHSTNSKAKGIFDAVKNVLYPIVSIPASSSLGDACGMFPKYPKPKYAEPTSASR